MHVLRVTVTVPVLSFIIIQLPPGDYLTVYISNLAQTGESADEAVIESLRARYGLDKPLPVQYFLWISGVLDGDFGYSYSLGKPVKELIWSRLAFTVTISFLTMVCVWIIAIPIGIYSATHQYKFFDYFFTFFGFAGMSIPPSGRPDPPKIVLTDSDGKTVHSATLEYG